MTIYVIVCDFKHEHGKAHIVLIKEMKLLY